MFDNGSSYTFLNLIVIGVILVWCVLVVVSPVIIVRIGEERKKWSKCKILCNVKFIVDMKYGDGMVNVSVVPDS